MTCILHRVDMYLRWVSRSMTSMIPPIQIDSAKCTTQLPEDREQWRSRRTSTRMMKKPDEGHVHCDVGHRVWVGIRTSCRRHVQETLVDVGRDHCFDATHVAEALGMQLPVTTSAIRRVSPGLTKIVFRHFCALGFCDARLHQFKHGIVFLEYTPLKHRRSSDHRAELFDPQSSVMSDAVMLQNCVEACSNAQPHCAHHHNNPLASKGPERSS